MARWLSVTKSPDPDAPVKAEAAASFPMMGVRVAVGNLYDGGELAFYLTEAQADSLAYQLTKATATMALREQHEAITKGETDE